MKQINILLAILLLSATTYGQKKFKEHNSYYAKPIHFGARIGINAFKIEGKGFDEKFVSGVVGGVFVQIRLNNTFQLQPELLFSTAKLDTVNEFSEAIDYLRFPEEWSGLKPKFLSIPLLLNIGVGQARGIKLQFGPQYTILLNKNQTLLQNGQSAFKSGDVDGVAGIMFQLGPINFIGRYTWGLGSVNNIQANTNWKKQSLQGTIGVTF
jgi:hypothetical protein